MYVAGGTGAMLARLVIALTITLAAMGPHAAARAEASGDVVIAVTASAWPFMGHPDDSSRRGFNPDLARLLCQRMALSCRHETKPFAALIEGVESGTVDIGLGNMLKTPEREARMLFSIPAWRSTTSLIGRRGLASVAPEAVKLQYRVCAIPKTQQHAFVGRQQGPAANLIDTPAYTDMFAALRQDRCDLAVLPTAAALDFLTSGNGTEFDYFGPPLTGNGLSGTVHLVVSRQHPELLEALNRALAEIMRDGSYRQLISRYFPFDIL